MSQPFTFLLGILLAFVPLRPAAHESCLPALNGDVPVCLHYFEGSRIELPVRAAIDAIDGKCSRLEVQLLQRQGVLLAPLGEPLSFDAQDCADMSTIALQLPDVRSETDFLLRLSVNAAENEANDELHSTVIALRVYPDRLLEPLARFATGQPLLVFDEQGRLRGFFDEQEIEYADSHEAVFGAPIALLVDVADPERLLEDREIKSAVIFREQIVDVPQVRTVSAAGRTRVYVELPLLHELGVSPLAQKALLRILQLVIDPDATDRG